MVGYKTITKEAMKILVAEDNSDTAMLYKHSLEDRQYKVIITTNDVLTGEERKRYLVKFLCLLYGTTDGNIGLHVHRIGIFNLMEIGEYSDIEDTVARELVDELIKKGLIVEEGNEGQIRLTHMGVVESKRIECSQRNRLEDWDNYQLYP